MGLPTRRHEAERSHSSSASIKRGHTQRQAQRQTPPPSPPTSMMTWMTKGGGPKAPTKGGHGVEVKTINEDNSDNN
jgi:hypothetical protein